MSGTSNSNSRTATGRAEITKAAGLHVRPARELSSRASEFQATIRIRKHESPSEEAVDAKSIMELLSLGAAKGTELVVQAEGEDAQEAARTIVECIENAG